MTSGSDYIYYKKIKENYNLTTADMKSGKTFVQHKKMKALLNTCKKDEYGDPILPSLTEIPISAEMKTCILNAYIGNAVNEPVNIE